MSYGRASVPTMTADLSQLIAALPAHLLPPGRLVTPEGGGLPRYWLSDAPVAADVWVRLRQEHPRSGLWPLLLGGLRREPNRPWADGEVYPEGMTAPDNHDPAALLAGWWAEHTDPDKEAGLASADQTAVTAPYDQVWPGPAPAGPIRSAPEDLADGYARELLRRPTRLGLVAADRGADTLAVTGWGGPANYANDTGQISAVVRSWEERFAARVVHVGFDTLDLSVAAPPATRDQALHVAAEHFAFCPDMIWQGGDTLTAYAEQLIGLNCWSFWWD
jgi:hypothetical protein